MRVYERTIEAHSERIKRSLPPLLLAEIIFKKKLGIDKSIFNEQLELEGCFIYPLRMGLL